MLVELPLGLDAGDGVSGEEVVGVLAGKVRGRGLFPLLVLVLDRAEQVALLALQLALGEAVLVGALNLLEHGRESGLDAVGLDPGREGGDVERVDVVVAGPAGGDVGRLGGLAALEQPRVEHHEGEALYDCAPEIRLVLDRFGVVLANEHELGGGRLWVGEDLDERGLVARHVDARSIGGLADGGALLCGLALGRRREVLLDPGFDLRHVEVAHGDDGHQVGPVPALVVGAQGLDGGVLDDLGEADGGAAGVERVDEEKIEQVLLEARVESLVEAPLLQHHAALELDLFRFERHGEGPVAEYLERLLGYLSVVSRYLEEVQGCRRIRCGRSGRGPNVLPMDSRYSMISCLAKRSVPLKAMCSTKWARPCWSSVSRTEPALTASEICALPIGSALCLM